MFGPLALVGIVPPKRIGNVARTLKVRMHLPGNGSLQRDAGELIRAIAGEIPLAVKAHSMSHIRTRKISAQAWFGKMDDAYEQEDGKCSESHTWIALGAMDLPRFGFFVIGGGKLRIAEYKLLMRPHQ